MKNFILIVIVGFALIISPVALLAADAPVIMAHNVTGSVSGPKFTDLTISVHVTNPGTSSLSNLTLSFVALPPIAKEKEGKTQLNIGNLDPGQSVDLSLQVAVPKFVMVDRVSRSPLFWLGTCLDAQGELLEFKAMSKPGGAL